MTADQPLGSHEFRPHVVVIGGGIGGLATAYFLRHGIEGPPPHVTVIEADDRLGGKVLTRQIGDQAIDVGPDSVAVRPGLLPLLEDLGLTEAVVPVARLGAYVWSRGRLRRLPQGAAFGVPDRLIPLVQSRLLSPLGTLRAGFDLALPTRRVPGDASIAELLRPRFGAQAFERLVEPLLGGMHAGSADLLSARSTVPDIDTLVRTNRSLYLALRRRRRNLARAGGAKAGTPALVTLDSGLGRLVTALTEALADADIRLGAPATALHRTADGFRIDVGEGNARTSVDADAVVLATPAFVTADLVEPLAAPAAAELRAIRYVDVATVTLTYPAEAVRRRLDATGFLVPPTDGRLLVGCSWLSAKWSHLSSGPVVVLRAMVGRADDQRWATLDDETLILRVHTELAEAMDLSTTPQHAHVQRWLRALPQYTVGHQARLDRLDAALAITPGLHVTGAAYRGVGIAGCITQAGQCAASVLARLGRRVPAAANESRR